MTDSSIFDIKIHINEIFEREASSILSDLSASSTLSNLMILATEEQVTAAKEYIIGVFYECYNIGHLNIVAMTNEQTLYGYAIIFNHINLSTTYCHKIFIYEQYRNQGIGKKLTKGLIDQYEDIGLVCQPQLVPFYESIGMNYKGILVPPEDDSFKNTRSMYSGLCIMRSTDLSEQLPIFLINEQDFQEIIRSIVKSNK